MSDQSIRAARVEDEPALTALWATAFTPALTPDQWLIDDERFAHTIVAEDEEGLCGSIYGLPKRLRESDGGIAEVQAIGSVAVAERSRGQGLARRLVTATLQGRRDADWALLFTGTPEVYHSSGFETFSMPPHLGRAVEPSRVGRDRGAGRARDRGAREPPPTAGGLRAFARRSSGPGPGARRPRPGDGRGAYEGRDPVPPGRGSAPVGYAITEHCGDVGMLLESAVLPGAGAARDDLLSAIGADWASTGVTSCDLAVPALEDEERALRAFAPAAVRQDDCTGMIRPLRREARLRGIRHFTAGDYF